MSTTPKDIEDICTVCEPHPEQHSTDVTRYPMKSVKKKPREESDLVLALEWRDSQKRRWYLMEKRPEEGRLGYPV